MAAPSEAGDYTAPDLYSSPAGPSGNAAMRGAAQQQGAGRVPAQGIVRSAETVPSAFGRGPIQADPRKFRYDMYRAQATKVSFSVTRDDRMSAEEAGETLDRIHRTLGIHAEEEHKLMAFDKGLFFAHTVNSGSTLQPGRSKIFVEGNQFDFWVIVKMLGEDMRRFFRAYADDIVQVNKQVLKEYDPYDPVKAEQHGWLVQTALERGMQKYPYLAHDSADACVNINTTERMALVNSKREVLSSIVNSADRMMANPRVQTADKFDSTTGGVIGA